MRNSAIKATVVLLSFSILIVGCSNNSKTSAPTTSSTLAVPDNVTWLCKPGISDNPCLSSPSATVVNADGSKTVDNLSFPKNPPIDCFYVYPTVSTQTTGNSNLSIESAETGVAIAQASRFSLDCNVYAPMYRQVTVSALLGRSTTTPNRTMAYNDVLNAWNTYLKDYNHGRGFVLIGHSQGAFVLTELIAQQIDNNSAVRKHLVSALLLGGNINVPIGKDVGGSFKNIPGCTSQSQVGCVIAYSSFSQEPPQNSLFGRTLISGDQVLCTNPASLSGGIATVDPYTPSKSGGIFSGINQSVTGSSVLWTNYPDIFTANCNYQDGASWLQISPKNDALIATKYLNTINAILGPTWGLHLIDVNITLGNLTQDVSSQTSTYLNS